jgi:hypothetical protein
LFDVLRLGSSILWSDIIEIEPWTEGLVSEEFLKYLYVSKDVVVVTIVRVVERATAGT